jgi:hypothetical protein
MSRTRSRRQLGDDERSLSRPDGEVGVEREDPLPAALGAGDGSGVCVAERQIGVAAFSVSRSETALRLASYFDTTPQFWLGLQTDYDVDVVSDELGDRLDREVRPPAARR